MTLKYPYLVTDAYPGTSDASLSRPLGHGVFVQVVEDHDGMVASAGREGLASGGAGIDDRLPEAIVNLDALLRSGAIGSRVFPTGPGGLPFAVFGGHWAASSVLILPSLLSILGPHLGNELVASVPHRDALLVFPASEASARDAARDFVREHESDGARPLTSGLFVLTTGWPHAIE